MNFSVLACMLLSLEMHNWLLSQLLQRINKALSCFGLTIRSVTPAGDLRTSVGGTHKQHLLTTMRALFQKRPCRPSATTSQNQRSWYQMRTRLEEEPRARRLRLNWQAMLTTRRHLDSRHQRGRSEAAAPSHSESGSEQDKT
jgi:hypothetical protein